MGAEPILVLSLGVALGGLVAHALSRYCAYAPYTPTLVVVGVLGGVAKHLALSPHTSPHLFASLEAWENIEGHTLLQIFLPPLLFVDTIHLEWHRTYKCLSQCVVLAGPGVLLSTGMTAAYVSYVLPYRWDWKLALAFGSVLAATDPIAVVASLHELEASPVLTMIIAGESMLNDGSAIVIWELFFGMHMQEVQGSPALLLARLVLGGIAAGIAFGTLMLFWISRMSRRHEQQDCLIQSAITISGAYLCFYLCDEVIGVSAVLAVVCAGTELSVFMWPLLHDRKGLERFWQTIEWLINTMLFLLAGLIIGGRCLVQIKPLWSSHGESEAAQGISLTDLAWVALSFVVVVAIRLATIFLLLPWLRRLGYGMSVRDAVAAAWGGLRGAVGLALALSMDEALEKRGDMRTGKLVLLHTSGVILGSLVVNAPSMPILLWLLGLTPATAADDGTRRRALLDLRKRVERFAWREFQALQQHPRAPVGEAWKERVASVITPLRRSDGTVAPRRHARAARRNSAAGTAEPELDHGTVTLAQAPSVIAAPPPLRRTPGASTSSEVNRASRTTVGRSTCSTDAFSADPLWSLLGTDSYSLVHQRHHPSHTREELRTRCSSPAGRERAPLGVGAACGEENSVVRSPTTRQSEHRTQRGSDKHESVVERRGSDQEGDGAGVEFIRQVTDRGGWWRGLHAAHPWNRPLTDSTRSRIEARRRWHSAINCVFRLVRPLNVLPPEVVTHAARVEEVVSEQMTELSPRAASPPAVVIDMPTPWEEIAVRSGAADGATRDVATADMTSAHLWGRSKRPSEHRLSRAVGATPAHAEELMRARAIFLNLVKTSYHEQLAEGLLPSRSFLAFELTNSADVAADRLYLPLSDWPVLLQTLQTPRILRLLACHFAPKGVTRCSQPSLERLSSGASAAKAYLSTADTASAGHVSQRPPNNHDASMETEMQAASASKPATAPSRCSTNHVPTEGRQSSAWCTCLCPCVAWRLAARSMHAWIGRQMRTELIKYHLRASYVITCFITAHASAQHEMRWMFGSKHDFMHLPKRQVVCESQAAVEAASRFLSELAALPIGPVHTQAGRHAGGRAEILVQEVATRQAAAILLTRIERFIDGMRGHGIIDRREAAELTAEVTHDRRVLDRAHVLPQLSRSLEAMGTAECAEAWSSLARLTQRHAQALTQPTSI